MSTHIPPEMRLWRTDDRGRAIYALISNDPRRPSDSDPLLGTMDSTIVAQDVIDTHNGVLSMYGRRYAQSLAAASSNKGIQEDEVYFRVNAGEREQLLDLTRWLNDSPFRSLAVVEKLQKVLEG